MEGPVVSLTSGTTAFMTVPSATPGGSRVGPAVRVTPLNSMGSSTSNNNGSSGVSNNNGGGDVSNENGGGGTSNENSSGGTSNNNGGENGEPGDALATKVDELRQRVDTEDWTEELKRVYRAFECGRVWGVEWVLLVDRFYNFEAAWGYKDMGGAILTTRHPKAMEHWLGRAWKWEKTVNIGVLGDIKSTGTFVALWWDW